MVILKNIAIKDNISINSSATLQDALNVMRVNNKGVVVVLDNNKVVGILTERDILSVSLNNSSLFLNILNFVKKDIIKINYNRTIDYALYILSENNIRRAIVVDNEDNFYGVINQDDILFFLEQDNYKNDICVGEIITTRNLIKTNSNSKIIDIVQLMKNNNIGAVIIFDDEPLGIFTERDLVRLLSLGIDLNKNIKDFMQPIDFVEFDMPLKELVDFMLAKNITKVLVKKSNDIIGIIGLRDIAYNIQNRSNKILETKLKNIKNVLNYIGEILIEIYHDGNEFIIRWVNDVALEYFNKDILDKPINHLLKNWEDIYNILSDKTRFKNYEISINNLSFEVSGSYYYLNQEEVVLLILKDITEYKKEIIKEKERIKELEVELSILQDVMDQQQTIIFITNGLEIIKANKTFLNFFDVEGINEFKLKFGHFNNVLINHEDFFYTKNKNWIEELKKKHIKDRIISIVDSKTITPKAFNVQFSALSSSLLEGFYVVTLTDITDIKLESQKYYYHATHDALTGLYNRAYFLDRIKFDILNAKRYNQVFSVIIFDIDHFKKFNDTYGHLKGDEVLKAVAKVASNSIRKNDLLARWGGEEFIVLLDSTNKVLAKIVAENIRKNIENIKLRDLPTITSSFGVSEYINGDDEDSIVKRADEALYRAKENGRNRVELG